MSKLKHKIYFLIAMVILLCVLLVAGGLFISRNSFVYSNLADGAGRARVKTLLSDSNIPEENIELLFRLFDEYNSVPYDNLVESGWKKAIIPFFSYDNRDGFEHLDAQPDNLINCRTTAFLVLKDNINFGKTDFVPTENIDPPSRGNIADENDLLHYDLLFSELENPAVNSSEIIAESVIGHWEAVGIEFPDGEIQLITAYGVSETTIKNFHTAIAVYDGGDVWLLEKYDPIHPYQLSRFTNQEQMIDYMKKRVSDSKYGAVFSNDKCLWLK